MNGANGKIEIFRPFGEAFELTKKILFQPFNFEKWFVIGFAAFLTHLNGGGFNFRFPMNGDWNANTPIQEENVRSFLDRLTPMWLALIGVGIVVLFAIFVVLTWVRARGHFIFIDCVVRDRGAIVQPWKEYRAEGNNYFIFLLLFFICCVGFFISTAVIVVVPIVILNPNQRGMLALSPLLLLIILLPLFLLFVSLVQFVAPVMYRRRCNAWSAALDLLSLVGANLGVFILYVLFSLVVGLGVVVVTVLLMCMTCCIAAIPYVGTVMFLPIYVFIQSFSLLFLRQFGSGYDVWALMSQPTPPPLPS